VTHEEDFPFRFFQNEPNSIICNIQPKVIAYFRRCLRGALESAKQKQSGFKTPKTKTKSSAQTSAVGQKVSDPYGQRESDNDLGDENFEEPNNQDSITKKKDEVKLMCHDRKI
jgi:hypothetical protein